MRKEERTLASFDFRCLHVAQMGSNIVNEVLAVRVAQDLGIQIPRLLEVDYDGQIVSEPRCHVTDKVLTFTDLI